MKKKLCGDRGEGLRFNATILAPLEHGKNHVAEEISGRRRVAGLRIQPNDVVQAVNPVTWHPLIWRVYAGRYTEPIRVTGAELTMGIEDLEDDLPDKGEAFLGRIDPVVSMRKRIEVVLIRDDNRRRWWIAPDIVLVLLEGAPRGVSWAC